MAVNGIVERGGCTKLREGGGGAGQEIGFTFSFYALVALGLLHGGLRRGCRLRGRRGNLHRRRNRLCFRLGRRLLLTPAEQAQKTAFFFARSLFLCRSGLCGTRGFIEGGIGCCSRPGGFWRRRSKLLRYRFSRNIKLDGRPCYPLVCTGLFGFRRLGSALRRYRLRCGLSSLGCLSALRLLSQTCFFSLARNSSKLSLFGGTTLGRAAGFLCMAGGLQAHGVRFCAAGGLSVRRRVPGNTGAGCACASGTACAAG